MTTATKTRRKKKLEEVLETLETPSEPIPESPEGNPPAQESPAVEMTADEFTEMLVNPPENLPARVTITEPPTGVGSEPVSETPNPSLDERSPAETGSAPSQAPIVRLICPKCKGTGIWEWDHYSHGGTPERRKGKCYRCANTPADHAKGFQDGKDLIRNRLRDRRHKGIRWVVMIQFSDEKGVKRSAPVGFTQGTEAWTLEEGTPIAVSAESLKPGDKLIVPNKDAELIETTVVSVETKAQPSIPF